MSELSWISFLTFQLILVLVILLMAISPVTPKGIRIRLLRPEVSAYPSPAIQPLVVRLERRGREPALLFVDWEPVATEGFDTILRDELSRRPPDWPVYVEGDGDVEWRDVAGVVDRVRGLDAQVVLLTHAR